MSFRWKLEAQVTSGTTFWSDLTSRVREGLIERGYDSDEDKAADGVLEAILNNRDGALTPTNSQSPYTGVDLERGVRASVVLTYDGSPYSAQTTVPDRDIAPRTQIFGTTQISTGPYVVQATVTNDSTEDVYLGADGVSTASGLQLPGGDSIELDMPSGDILYGVSGLGTTGSVTVLAVAQPTTFRRFVGKSKAWIPQFTEQHDEVVRLEAVDGFEELERVPISYAHQQEVLDLGPVGYWPLNEEGEFVSKAKDRSGNGRNGDYFGGRTLGAASLVAGNQSVDFSTGYINVFRQLEGTVGSNYTLSAWFSYDDLGRYVASFGDFNLPADGQWYLFTGGASNLVFSVGINSTYEGITSSQTLSTGTEYHAVVAVTDTGGATLWINGTVDTSTTLSAPPSAPSGEFQIGWAAGQGDNDDRWDGRMSDVALFGFAASSSQVDLLWQSGSDAWASELPGARIGRVLDLQGWPSTARDLSVGDTPLAGMTQVTTVLEHVQNAAYADGGVFFISRDGAATFQGRTDRWTGQQLTDTGRVATFSDTGDLSYAEFEMNYDTVRLVDRTEVSGTNVGTAAYNSSSTRYPNRTGTISSLSNNESDITSRAEWETNRWDSVNLRPDGVKIATVTTGQEVTCATLDVADTVRLRRNKSGADVVSQDMRVTGIRERISEGGLSWSWEADTLDATNDQPALFDSTEGFSALDTGVLGY